MNDSRIRLPLLQDSQAAAKQRSRMKSIVDRPAGSLVVHEIYASIQGESTFAGLPCTFVRLTGCPLRCRWCDTPHAFTEGSPMTIDQIVTDVDRHSPMLVEVTGGEPLSHPECDQLLRALADTGRQVLLETSGAISIETVDPRVISIVDMKCPSSSEIESNNYENLRRLRPRDEVKFVIGNRDDFDWSVAIVRQYALTSHPVLFSPVHGELPHQTLTEWILSTSLPIRQQVALHKVIWGADARGV